MARKPEPEKAPNHERWLVSYADFITLLFAFFVVMFASSNTDVTKQKQMEKSMQEAFGGLGFVPVPSRRTSMGPDQSGGGAPIVTVGVQADPNSLLGPVTTDVEGGGEGPDSTGQSPDFPAPSKSDDPNSSGGMDWNPTPTPSPKSTNGEGDHTGSGSPELKQIYQELQNALANELSLGKVDIREEKRGVVISLSEAGFFDSGSARLNPSSLQTIDQIARKLKAIRKKDVAIRIEGHTDDVPLATSSSYRDNLELSTARANSVIYRLVEKHRFPPRALIASGYGEWRPIASNQTPEGRARNRRVDIVILNDDFAGLEPGQN